MALVVYLFAGGLFFFGWTELRPTLRLRNGSETPGVVVRYQRRRPNERFWVSIIRYEVAGRTFEIAGPGVGRGTRPYQEGDTVTVLYRPSDPADAIVKGFQAQLLAPLFCLVFGLLAAVLGLVPILMLRQSTRSTSSPASLTS